MELASVEMSAGLFARFAICVGDSLPLGRGRRCAAGPRIWRYGDATRWRSLRFALTTIARIDSIYAFEGAGKITQISIAHIVGNIGYSSLA